MAAVGFGVMTFWGKNLLSDLNPIQLKGDKGSYPMTNHFPKENVPTRGRESEMKNQSFCCSYFDFHIKVCYNILFIL